MPGGGDDRAVQNRNWSRENLEILEFDVSFPVT